MTNEMGSTSAISWLICREIREFATKKKATNSSFCSLLICYAMNYSVTVFDEFAQ